MTLDISLDAPDRTDAQAGPAAPEAVTRRSAALADTVLALVAAAGLLLYARSSEVNRDITMLVCMYTLVGLGMYIPLVLHGDLSLAYGAYVSIGAYTVALLSTESGVAPLLGIPIGMVVAGVTALVLGLGTARLNGFYLAGVTLLFDRAFRAFLADTDWLGGAAGIPSFDAGSVLGYELDRSSIAWIAVIATILAVVYGCRLRRGSLGTLARFQREVGPVGEAYGVRSTAVKVLSLALGAALAAMGGALLGLSSGAVFPETYQFNVVVVAIFAPLLGGQRSPWGALIGAVAVAWLYFGLDVGQDVGALVFALVVVAIVRVAPGGLISVGQRIWQEGARRVR